MCVGGWIAENSVTCSRGLSDYHEFEKNRESWFSNLIWWSISSSHSGFSKGERQKLSFEKVVSKSSRETSFTILRNLLNCESTSQDHKTEIWNLNSPNLSWDITIRFYTLTLTYQRLHEASRTCLSWALDVDLTMWVTFIKRHVYRKPSIRPAA